MVAGYVVMRVALVLPVGARGPAGPGPPRGVHRPTSPRSSSRRPAGSRCWSPRPRWRSRSPAWSLLVLVEFAGPWIAETRKGGTPWHPHHIAERYGLLVIIALGEGVLGTVVALSARSSGPRGPGWSVDAVAVARRRHGADVRHVVDLLRRAVRRGPGRAAGAVVRVGLRAHPADRRRRGDGRAGSTSPPTTSRASSEAERRGDRAHRGGPGGGVPRSASSPSTRS